jgi:hypothetical protein
MLTLCTWKISNLLNRPLQKFRDLVHTTVPTIFFFNVNTFLLSEGQFSKLFCTSFEIENRQTNLF